MAHLFTYQDFKEGVIGLAYVGNPKRNAVGGICTESNDKLYSSISSVATSNFPSFIPAHLRPVPPPHHATHPYNTVVIFKTRILELYRSKVF